MILFINFDVKFKKSVSLASRIGRSKSYIKATIEDKIRL